MRIWCLIEARLYGVDWEYMFVRSHTVKSISYLALVENLWDPLRKRYHQKRIASLGKTTEFAASHRAGSIITALSSFCQRHHIPSLSDGIVITNLSHREDLLSRAFDFGIWEIATHILKNLGIRATVEALHKKYTANLSLPSLLSATTTLIAHRLTTRSDASERATHAWYINDLFVPGKLPLDPMDFYRTLDFLVDHKDAIEGAYFEQNRDLFSQPLDLVLFDTTSIYYWGNQDVPSQETDLLQYGFSKDGKGNLKQLIVGVLMTSSGVPIAHEVFPGNTADVTSFGRIIKIIKEKYKLEKVVLVADRGMVSEENLLILEEMKLGYIVGVRMRSLPHDLQTALMTGLDPKDMEKVNDHLFTREYHVANFSPKNIKDWFLDRIIKGKRKNPLPTMDIPTIEKHVRNRRFFVFLNPLVEKATKDKREFFKTIIERKIRTTNTKDWIVKNGYKKYLSFEDGINPTLDEDKLAGEELFDGKWVLVTNVKEVTPVEAGSYYQTLQKIERGFRDLKNLITIQPIFHYTEKRIRAHIFVCFLALVVKWHIFRVINPYSQEDGRRFLGEMDHLKAIEVDRTQSLYVRTELSNILKEGIHKLSMRTPEKILFRGSTSQELIPHKGGRPKQQSPDQLPLIA